MSSSAFPKILHLGDKAIREIWDDNVEITEKVDGSQLRWMVSSGHMTLLNMKLKGEIDA